MNRGENGVPRELPNCMLATGLAPGFDGQLKTSLQRAAKGRAVTPREYLAI
jgi:hypothetical protein